MMTLFRVTVRPPPGAYGQPLQAEVVKAGPAIHHPPVGASFAVTDAWGREHRGMIVEIEDLGITRGSDVLGQGEAESAIGRELRTVALTIAPRAS